MRLNKKGNQVVIPRGAFVLWLCAVALIPITNCRNSTQQVEPEKMTTETRANDPRAIHERAITVDMHADTAQRLVDENVDLNQLLADGHLDAVRAKEGGLDAQFFSIWVEPQLFGAGGAGAMKRADIQIEAVRDLAAKHPETWEVATTADDIRRVTASRKNCRLDGSGRRLCDRRQD